MGTVSRERALPPAAGEKVTKQGSRTPGTGTLPEFDHDTEDTAIASACSSIFATIAN